MKDLQRLEAQTKILHTLSAMNAQGLRLPHWIRERYCVEQERWLWEFLSWNATGAQHISEIAKYL